MTPTAAPAHASPRHVSGRAVILTGAAVIVLWAASFALSYAPLGAASLPIALAIAVAKAVLVALYFMELVRARLSVRLTVISALALLFTLIAFMVADIATRDRPPLVPATTPAPAS